MTRDRADKVLVARGLFESRAKAQEAITAGLVSVAGRPVSRASDMIDMEGEIDARAPYPWVSRGGVKLAAALDHFTISPEGLRCLDIGASTGGFSDVLLARGARSVHAIDVGHSQLHPRIAAAPRLTAIESCDARTLTPDLIGHPVELVVADVSFISLRLILPVVPALCAPGAMLVVLIKPQFEAGPANVRKGLVRDEAVRHKVRRDITEAVEALGFTPRGSIPSPIEGGDGNVEYLLAADFPKAGTAP